MFYEGGGIYDHQPHCKEGGGGREFVAGEPTAVCPRCGQRFAASDDDTAEGNRDLHFDGDQDIPSICRHLPTQRPRLVVKGGED